MTELRHPTDPSEQEPALFYGREEEIDWVTEQLAHGQQVLAVYGIRRIGKTAFLRALGQRLPDRYRAAYVDVGQAGDPDLPQIAAALASAVKAKGLPAPVVDEDAFAANPRRAWYAYVDALQIGLIDRQLVLLLDNGDRAHADLRQLLLQTPIPKVVAAKSPQDMAEGVKGLPFVVPSLTLGPLEREAAAELVKALVAPKASIDPWAVRRVLEITSDQPFYIHLFCRVLLASDAYRVPITPPHVEAALASILDTPVAEFIVAWQRLLPREQVMLSVFASLRGHGGVATQYDIQKRFVRHGLAPSLKEIVDTLDALVARNMLERMGTNTYRFRLELYRLWVDRLHPPGDLVRKHGWRFGRSFLASALNGIGQRLAKRRTLWLSIGAAALVMLLLAVQPALWRGCARSTGAPTQTVAVRPAAQTPTPTLLSSITRSAAEPAVLLPGFDLLVMSRADAQAPWQIDALDTRAGKRIRLTETTANDRTPKWSPDGRSIAFASDRDGDREIYVMDLERARAEGASYQPVNLTRNEEPDWQPAWSPDGERIAFSCYRDDNWEICVVAADGNHLERLTADPESDISPTWSPDGNRILFVSRRLGDADLYVLEIGGGTLTQLTRSERDEYDPAWSPDGAWIAFVTQIETQSDLYVMRADGSEALNLTNSAYANDFQPVWTADSQSVIYVSYTAAEGNHDLYIVRRDGSEQRVLVDSDTDDLAPSLRDLGP
ncbi:MAG: PD40 domain-containing protein [Anaerolineae bacterium]|nr:PD40 domain-containing protein [Anaerolineae bacterium]